MNWLSAPGETPAVSHVSVTVDGAGRTKPSSWRMPSPQIVHCRGAAAPHVPSGIGGTAAGLPRQLLLKKQSKPLRTPPLQVRGARQAVVSPLGHVGHSAGS